MRWVIVAGMVVCCGAVWADELPEDTNKIKTLTVEQAEARAKGFKNEQDLGLLSLEGLTAISPEVAAALAKYDGKMSLGGLATLSPEAARGSAQHQRLLSLDGLTNLSDEAAAALRSNPKISLPEKFRR